ncbi:hypothetical protein PR202_gb17603 [Eleusine coracana subsp. coracana]|uniref:Uncharacterized protein n=1 Tax=Eleusine coracana subsp. coracana TaxID=191504 RepID=A0AAV5F4Q2_ELECO|nr:hypothetical protein PR202_gb17603 [Eleusine coracana subsp. coracana]
MRRPRFIHTATRDLALFGSSHTPTEEGRRRPLDRTNQPPPHRAAAPATMSLAAIFVCLLVSALLTLDSVLDLARKRGGITGDELKLRMEITQLLKEATALSTPSTFAQAAKLKRLAAAKEKELAKIQELSVKGKQSLYDKYGKVLLITKEGCFPGEVWMLQQVVCEKRKLYLLLIPHFAGSGGNSPMAIFDLSRQQATQPEAGANIPQPLGPRSDN